MVEFSNESINLAHEMRYNFQFLELPSEEFFLAYRTGPTFMMNSMAKSIGEKATWSEKIPQNDSAAFAMLEFSGIPEQFYYYFDHKGDICALINIKIEKADNIEFAIFYTVSHNYGKKWAVPRRISPEDLSIRVTGSPIILEKGYFFGHIVVPVEDINIARFLLLFSQDNGKSWNFSLCIEKDDDEDQDFIQNTENQQSLNEVADDIDNVSFTPCFSIVEGDNGIIHGICRFHNDRYLSTCSTKDLGTTWSLPQFISEIGLPDFQCFALSHVLLKNEQKLLLFGVERNENSLMLTIWLASRFEGLWERVWETSPPMNAKMEVCHFSQDTKGKVHLFYNTSKTEIVHLWGDGSKLG